MRVLLVEDEEWLARMVRRKLAAEEIRVELEHDGRDGLDRARRGEHDAIVLDILLPSLDGYEICRALRAEEIWTPILMLTAKDAERDETRSLDAGADDYLRKPFSISVLAARLRALVRRGAEPRPAILQAGSLTLDPAARTCCRDEQEIELTAREFDLLAALMRADGAAVSKDDLLARIWGPEFNGGANAVEVYVSYLRSKIDEPFGAESIETVRGVGYKVVAGA